MERRHYTLNAVEVRAKSEETEGRAKGYAAVFNSDSLDLGGFIERIAPGAFKRSLKAAAAGEHNIYALWAHRDDAPLGSTGGGKLTLKEDEHGLYFEMDTARMTDAQLDALKDGDLRMSFGFSVREQEWVEDEKGHVERTLNDVDLYEVSFVISPAYPETEAALRSHDLEEAKRSLEEWRSASKVEEPEIDEEKRVALMKRALLKRI